VLLTGPAGAAWAKAAPEATKTLNGLTLATHVVGGTDLSDPEHRFLAGYGITESGATLVRPDGFVAWRAKDMTSDARGELTRVLGKVLRG
jgi:putative polyketide hydroxylase